MFVFLDFVGTIALPIPDAETVYFESGRSFGSGLDRGQIGRRFRELYAFHFLDARQSQSPDLPTDDVQERRRWLELVTDLFDDVTDATSLFQSLWEHFAQPASWTLYPDVATTLEILKSRGARFGIASNFDSRLFSICNNKVDLRTVEWIFPSSRIGWNKPSRRFFDEIANRTSAASTELIMVGDDDWTDYQAALSAGWSAIHLVRTHNFDLGGHQIATLTELPERIDQFLD
jgi:putative hydrolase of the HAD superfamily